MKLKLLNNKISVFLGCLFLLLVILSVLTVSYQRSAYLQYARYLPTYNLNKFPPKVLVYSSITSEYLIDQALSLHTDFGFDGFILTQIAGNGAWPGDLKIMQAKTDIVRKGNQACSKAGINSNFLKISLEQGDFGLWQDDQKWAADLANLTKVAAWAKKTGFKGIAIDTETYHSIIFNNALSRNNRVPNIKKLIEKRGFETIKSLIKGFPDAEILVLPEGHLYAYSTKKPHKYRYWINYFNGMLKARPPHGIDLFVERTYEVHDQLKLKSYFKDIQGEIIADNVDDPVYWLERCSIAFGMWPLGREYSDKRANLSIAQFKEQFNTSIQYCPKYVWIYAHGLSWWQTKDAVKYGFNPQEAPLPTVRRIAVYKSVVKQAKRRELKMFYRELKNNKKFSYLDLLLEFIFVIR